MSQILKFILKNIGFFRRSHNCTLDRLVFKISILPKPLLFAYREFMVVFHGQDGILWGQKYILIPLLIPFESECEGMDPLDVRLRTVMDTCDVVVFDYLELFENLDLRFVLFFFMKAVRDFGVLSTEAFVYRPLGLNFITKILSNSLIKQIRRQYSRTSFGEPIISRRILNAKGCFFDLLLTTEQSYSQISCIYHCYKIVKNNFREYLKTQQVKLKKYFFVLWPILGVFYLVKALARHLCSSLFLWTGPVERHQ